MLFRSALRGLANAACDISDGLMQDLGRILAASGVGALINIERLPLSSAIAGERDASVIAKALSGGEDYELVFTASPHNVPEIERRATPITTISCIGCIETQPGLRVRHQGEEWDHAFPGYDHFKGAR